MARYDKNCAVCGKLYQYCTNCDQFASYPTYMAMFCSQECVDLLDILPQFKSGVISKADTKELIKNYPAEKAKMLKGSLAAAYAEVMAEDDKESAEPKDEPKPSIKEQTDSEIANNTVKKTVYDGTREATKNIPRSIAYRKH